MNRSQRSIGHSWEDFAARRLAAAGLQILARRYSCRIGEIDLIALDGDTLVFVEVRFRARSAYGDAAESVTAQKQRRIISAARHFLMRHPEYEQSAIRMDVIALEAAGNSAPAETNVRWIRAAFDAH